MDLPYKRVSGRECVSHSLFCVLSYDYTEGDECMFEVFLHGLGAETHRQIR